MIPDAGLIGLTVVLDFLDHTPCNSPIGRNSVTGGDCARNPAQPFPARGLNPATRTAREAVASSPAAVSRADPFEQSNHGGVNAEKAQPNHVR